MNNRHPRTPLQVILEDDAAFHRAMQATGATRFTVWRWRTGKSFPQRDSAALLIDEFADSCLDYNGCYEANR